MQNESKDYWLIDNAGILGKISKIRTREQSLRFFVTIHSIDKIVKISREYDSQFLTDKHEIIEGYLLY
jgi:hypothetical protein